MSGHVDNAPLWFKQFQQRFYRSKEWKRVRRQAILRSHGISVVSGKQITPPDVILVDHIKPITPENYKDPNITLNVDNLQVMTLKEHNALTFEKDPDFDLKSRTEGDTDLF